MSSAGSRIVEHTSRWINSGFAEAIRKLIRSLGGAKGLKSLHDRLRCRSRGGGAAVFAGAHTMVPWSQLYGENFSGVREGLKVLALSYDDGPNDPWTMRLLEVLEQEQVPATFFMLGARVRARPEMARAVGEAGHAIGNHSFTHPNLIFAGDARLRQELEETSKAIEDATGERPFLFRPPFGGRRPGTFRVVEEPKMFPVMCG